MGVKKKYYLKFLYVFILVFFDLLAYYISLISGFFVRKSIISHFFPHLPLFDHSLRFYVFLWWIPLCFLFFMILENVYTTKISYWEELKRTWKAILIASVVVLSGITLQKLGTKVSRLVLILCFSFNFFTIPIIRIFTKRILFSIFPIQEKVVILGAGRAGVAVARGFKKDKCYYYKIIGFLDDYKAGEVNIDGENYPILGRINEIFRLAEKENIHTAILAMPSIGSEKIKQLFIKIRHYVPNVLIVPELQGISLITSELDYLFYEEIFLLHTKNNLANPINRILKRISEYFLIIPILILCMPIMIVIALVIKLTSSGPIIYTQNRIGRNGRPFKIYKFRTMYRDAEKRLKKLLQQDPEAREEWRLNFKLKKDPRVTKIGSFLRKTSLDELPQIFNVIKGEMSLVGPRPVTKEELEEYYKEDGEFYKMVKPGITGLWQVSGRNNTSYEQRKKLDVWYIQNWCIWLDIVILLQTFKCVIKGEGAY